MMHYEYVDEDPDTLDPSDWEEHAVYEHELHERYDGMLDEVYDEVVIGFAHFSPSEILKNLAKVDYRVGFSEWLDSETGETIWEVSDDGVAEV